MMLWYFSVQEANSIGSVSRRVCAVVCCGQDALSAVSCLILSDPGCFYASCTRTCLSVRVIKCEEEIF